MEKDQGKDREPVSPELQKCIRFQQAGWILFCCWPVAAVVAAMRNVSPMIISVMSFLMIMVAIIIFAIGHTGRQELKERDEHRP